MTHAQTNRGRLRVSVLAALRDNYVYVLWDEQQREAIVVDPGEAAPVISFFAHPVPCAPGHRCHASSS